MDEAPSKPAPKGRNEKARMKVGMSTKPDHAPEAPPLTTHEPMDGGGAFDSADVHSVNVFYAQDDKIV
jgi:hypothetical protein